MKKTTDSRSGAPQTADPSGKRPHRNQRQVGSHYEELAAEALQAKGLRILEKNFRTRTGEIDLVARDGACLVFVEVKYRRTGICGSPEAAVNAAKQKTIMRTAALYLLLHDLPEETDCRFDVAAVSGDNRVVHYPNAFGGLN